MRCWVLGVDPVIPGLPVRRSLGEGGTRDPPVLLCGADTWIPAGVYPRDPSTPYGFDVVSVRRAEAERRRQAGAGMTIRWRMIEVITNNLAQFYAPTKKTRRIWRVFSYFKRLLGGVGFFLFQLADFFF